MEIKAILDHIDSGVIALPEFQRGYVWNREQVRGFLLSLYKRHPVGSLLVWVTETSHRVARGDSELHPGYVKLLLDGQQRISTLYGIIRGKTPPFFHGKEKVLKDLYFNVEEEVFEYYGPIKMRDNPMWVSVTELMQKGAGKLLQQLMQTPEVASNIQKYLDRLNKLDGIKQITMHIDEVTGKDKTIDIVVDIFNKINSGGTKLSKGDLALAKICAELPSARDDLNQRLEKWKNIGFNFKLDWLLRCINADLTGRAKFSSLREVSASEISDGIVATENRIDWTLNLIAGKLGLDHDRVLGAKLSFPVISRYLSKNGDLLKDQKEQNLLLYWYVNALLWGRYSGGSTESKIQQDLETLERGEGIRGLIDQLRDERATLELSETDFRGHTRGSRFYPLLYLLTRVNGSVDWELGVELRAGLLGKMGSLQVHHLFPKAYLKKHGFDKREINAIANFTFLTQFTNLDISDSPPSEYFPKILALQPRALKSHWIPEDPELWKPENYLEFLAARRELLAASANTFLNSLRDGNRHEEVGLEASSVFDEPSRVSFGGIENDEEQLELNDLNSWMKAEGLPLGELSYVLEDERRIINIDLAWPAGLQTGLSDSIAVLLDEQPELIGIVSGRGFKVFTNIDDFKKYVKEEILSRNVVHIDAVEQIAIEQALSVDLPEAFSQKYQKHRDGELTQPDMLKKTAFQHFAFIRSMRRQYDCVDISTAIILHNHLIELIDYLGEVPEKSALRAVQGAVYYFAESEDEQSDLGVAGFDDDVVVFNAVAFALGRVDLLIDLG